MWVFSQEGPGKLDPAGAATEVGLVLCPHLVDVLREQGPDRRR
jgi:hypothetical protein